MDSDIVEPVGEYPELPPEYSAWTPEGFPNLANPLFPPIVITKEMLSWP